MCKVKSGHNYSQDAADEAALEHEEVQVAAGSNGAVWKWAAGIMSSLVLILVGALIGDVAASIRYASLTTKLEQHTITPGHPVMVQRVSSIEAGLREIKEQQQDDSVVLNEIYRNLPDK